MSEKWDALLSAQAGRDTPVELSRRSCDPDAPVVTYRSRLFHLEPDGSIIVERPVQAMRDKAFSDGDDIEIVLIDKNERMVATCTIRATFSHKINAAVSVTCYRLSPGRRPQREQRRSFYRVSVAALDLPAVQLVHDNDDGVFQFNARMVNLSGGGLGVSVRDRSEVLHKIKRTRTFNCYARFDSANTLVAPVIVRHISAIGDDGLYLGLQFQVADVNESRILQDRLQHLCTEFQRASLKRRRA